MSADNSSSSSKPITTENKTEPSPAVTASRNAEDEDDGLPAYAKNMNNVDRLYAWKYAQMQDACRRDDMAVIKNFGSELLLDPLLPKFYRKTYLSLVQYSTFLHANGMDIGAAIAVMVSFADVDSEPRLRESLALIAELEGIMDRANVAADDAERGNVAQLRKEVDNLLADLHEVDVDVTDSEMEEQEEEQEAVEEDAGGARLAN